ncbi:MAG: hypothetical protein IID07_00320 [Gemmatimonadetes bacterium]|nr:hypothetical protein [Gemmatimonadota bacterium]
MPQEKIFAQARDELFSHINRCEVLSATDDDRTTWMNETIDYIGERYPDLVDPDLRELHAVGIRFCQPAINNIPAAVVSEPLSEPAAETVTVEVSAEPATTGKPIPATSEVSSETEATQEQDGGANAA